MTEFIILVKNKLEYNHQFVEKTDHCVLLNVALGQFGLSAKNHREPSVVN